MSGKQLRALYDKIKQLDKEIAADQRATNSKERVFSTIMQRALIHSFQRMLEEMMRPTL